MAQIWLFNIGFNLSDSLIRQPMSWCSAQNALFFKLNPNNVEFWTYFQIDNFQEYY